MVAVSCLKLFLRFTTRLLFACGLLWGSFAQATVWGQSSEPPIWVGALDRNDLEEIHSQEAILLDRLRRELHPRQVVLQYFPEDALEHAVQNQSIDFVISDALFYASLENRQLLRPLAGLVYPQAVDTDRMTASTVFVKKTPSHKQLGFSSLNGAHAYVLDEKSFGGFVAAAAEMDRESLRPSVLFSAITEVPGSQSVLVEKVLTDPQAVGILPTCSLERLAQQGLLDLSQIEIVHGISGQGFGCLRSTRLYPGWTLASLGHVDIDTARKIASIALSSTSAGSLHWSFPPTNFKSVHNVLIDLRIGPYAGIKDNIWFDIYNRYKVWFLVILAALVAIVFHSFFVARLVRVRTRDLQNLMEKQKRMNQEILEARSRIESMEKVQTVSQMCTMFAHELKQPLGAIRNFSLGLSRRAEHGELDNSTLHLILDKVIRLTDNASAIVTHVRQYARAADTPRQREDLGSLVVQILDVFRKTAEKAPVVTLQKPALPLWVEVNSWEIEIAVLNLLKNATEACAGVSHPQIQVSVRRDDHHALLCVVDNGKGMAKEQLSAMFKPLFSTKKSGMGMGLAIASSIAESHGGRINAYCNASGKGLTLELVLPLAAAEQASISNKLL